MLSQLPKAILFILISLIAYQVALITWALYPLQENTYSWSPPPIRSSTKISKLPTKDLEKYNLFGRYLGNNNKETSKETYKEAPKTRLNLTLVGIIAASEPHLSSVIIESKRVQNSYFIDSMIDGTKAKVTDIYDDRIILDVEGELQTLLLDGLEESKEEVNKVSKMQPQSKAAIVNVDREELLSNPSKLMDFIKISPVREGREVKGYRVNPGRDPSLFIDAGLEAGDLAVELNGIDLTDISEAMSLMKEFPTMTEISLTVDRDSERHDLFFSLP